jgi:hypothetical protein
MPFNRVPIKGYPYQNIEDVELNEQPRELYNAYMNEANHYIKRPGLVEFADTSSSAKVEAMYYWQENDIVIIVSNQNIYKVTENGTLTDITSAQLTGNNRPTFAEVVQGDGSHHLAMADGGNIISATTATTTQIADGDAPTTVTSIAFIDGYLLANNANNQFYSSDLNDFDAWTATNVWTADTNNDNIDYIKVSNRDIYLMGERSIEVWQSTGSALLFERRVGAEVPDGIIAPYTVVDDSGILYYLNRDNKLIQGNKPVSTAIDKVIAGFTTVTDATGDIVQFEGRRFYMLNFPTEGRTFMYDILLNGWCEWAYWNAGQADYELFKGACAVYVPSWGVMLMGDKSNGKIYTLDKDTFTDDGDLIRMKLLTGHITHGTTQTKRSNTLRLHMKRGVATVSETAPEMLIRWKDDGEDWTNAVQQSLGTGTTGVDRFYVEAYRNGMYRSRQYEIVHTDNVQHIQMDIEEDVELMTS